MAREYMHVNPENLFPNDPVIPSRVRDAMYLCYCQSALISKIENSNADDDPFATNNELCKKELDTEVLFSGKWMLFYDKIMIDMARGLTELDYAWQFMFPLVDNFKSTGIRSALCSTAFPGPYPADPNSPDGVIMGFTSDYRNKRGVKKAADAIRQVLHYPRSIYYKTDEATRLGLYKWYGHRFICIYKHTPDCKLYERDEVDPLVWRLIEFED